MQNLWELPFPTPVPLLQVLLWQPQQPKKRGGKSAAEENISASRKRAKEILYQLTLIARYASFLYIAHVAWLIALPHDFGKIRRLPVQVWAAPLVAFNFLCVILLYGPWHWLLYGGAGGGPVLEKLAQRKFSRQREGYRVGQGFCLTMVGVAISSAAECLLWREVAAGRAALQPGNFGDSWLRSSAMCVLIVLWLEVHSWFARRLLHPWGVRVPLIGDPGYLLYRLIRWVHHESPNPGPWSALSMHPLEHVLVFSSYVLPLFLSMHPVHILFLVTCSRIAPLAEYDGFDRPAGGGLCRHLHHARNRVGEVGVNFGNPDLMVSLDEYFGTLDDGEEFRRKAELPHA